MISLAKSQLVNLESVFINSRRSRISEEASDYDFARSYQGQHVTLQMQLLRTATLQGRLSPVGAVCEHATVEVEEGCASLPGLCGSWP